MRVCIPVEERGGLDREVYGHFGSAPIFALVDTETMAATFIDNRDHGHVHGACSPLRALGGQRVGAVIVGGIGAGAIRGLNAAGIQVFQCRGGTVADAVRQFREGRLPVVSIAHACGGHSAGHACASHGAAGTTGEHPA
jgi:predicted Fe-Mo cluster-binding NifX family protein